MGKREGDTLPLPIVHPEPKEQGPVAKNKN